MYGVEDPLSLFTTVETMGRVCLIMSRTKTVDYGKEKKSGIIFNIYFASMWLCYVMEIEICEEMKNSQLLYTCS